MNGHVVKQGFNRIVLVSWLADSLAGRRPTCCRPSECSSTSRFLACCSAPLDLPRRLGGDPGSGLSTSEVTAPVARALQDNLEKRLGYPVWVREMREIFKPRENVDSLIARLVSSWSAYSHCVRTFSQILVTIWRFCFLNGLRKSSPQADAISRIAFCRKPLSGRRML